MKKTPKLHTAAILLFTLIFALPMLRSGVFTGEGLRLIGANSPDAVWNLALIEELRHQFPPEHPGFVGIPLRGYHFLYHLLLAIVAKLTFIPAVNLYFHVFPLIISFLWGYGVYRVVIELANNRRAALLSAFFSYFGGSFSYILPLVWKQDLNISSGFGICQPYDCSLVNPAFASSVVLLIWSFYGLLKYLKTAKRKWAILLSILSGVSVGFKVYSGMILMGALLIAALWRLVYSKKLDLLLAFLGALSVSLLFFLPFNANYGFLVYQPLWPPHRVMQGPLNFTSWDELWEQYSYYQDYFGIFKLELWANAVFFFGNLGTRILALTLLVRLFRQKLVKTETVHYLTMLAIAYFIPLFFIQPAGGPFNMIQLYWYFLFLIAISVGPVIVFLGTRLKDKATKTLFYITVVILTIPSSASVLIYYATTYGSFISSHMLESLRFLKSYKDYEQTVLEIPPYGLVPSTAVSAFGGKRMYVADEVAKFDYKGKKEERLELIETIIENEENYNEKTKMQLAERIKEEEIKLIYDRRKLLWLENWEGVELIFNNTEANIYDVLSL